jgi:hypothetical protein
MGDEAFGLKDAANLLAAYGVYSKGLLLTQSQLAWEQALLIL